jgi:hypothetical protein
MHADITIGDSHVYLADEMPEFGCKSPAQLGGTPVTFYVYVENVDAAWKRAIDAGAKETMPLMDMFWGDRCGKIDDPFGHGWNLAQHVKDLTPDQIAAGHLRDATVEEGRVRADVRIGLQRGHQLLRNRRPRCLGYGEIGFRPGPVADRNG